MFLVRGARRAADAAFAQAQAAERAASIERARRVDERQQLVLLHDTALATLTMVASSAIDASSPRLRSRAASDLAVLSDLAGSADGPAGSVRLDERLARVVGEASGVPARG